MRGLVATPVGITGLVEVTGFYQSFPTAVTDTTPCRTDELDYRQCAEPLTTKVYPIWRVLWCRCAVSPVLHVVAAAVVQVFDQLAAPIYYADTLIHSHSFTVVRPRLKR
jgi:hypothetical protein